MQFRDDLLGSLAISAQPDRFAPLVLEPFFSGPELFVIGGVFIDLPPFSAGQPLNQRRRGAYQRINPRNPFTRAFRFELLDFCSGLDPRIFIGFALGELILFAGP